MFKNNLFMQTSQKKWDNFGNFWPIKLKFGLQVPFMDLHATETFGNDLTVF